MLYFFYVLSRKSLFHLCLLIILCSCSCRDRQNSEIVDNYSDLFINNVAVPDTMDISSLVSDVKILRLTDPIQKPITRIDQLYALGNYYVVIDAVNTKRVNAYSADGKYLKTLMENGPTDKQSLNVTDCYVNEKDQIIIYDFAQMKLTTFDSNLIKKKYIQGAKLFHYNHIASIPGTENFVGYATYNLYNTQLQNNKKSPSNLDILSDELSLIEKHLTYPSKFEGITLITPAKSFFPYKDSLRFFRTYDPYIYNISKNEIQRRYKITYSKGNFPSDFLEAIVKPHLKIFKEIGRTSPSIQALYLYNKGYTSPKNWLEDDSLIYLSSINFLDNSTSLTNTLILKGAKKPVVLSAGIFLEKEKFKISFPQFTSYDKKTAEFLASCTGNQLKNYLFKDSPLISVNEIVDDSFYLIKVKFKHK